MLLKRNVFAFTSHDRKPDMQEKLEAKLRDIARRRQTRIATRDLRGSA